MGENEETGTKKRSEKEAVEKGYCPVCGAKLVPKEGCMECPQCGWSICVEA